MAPRLAPEEARRLGEVGLKGWRQPVADAASRPLTKVTPIEHDELRSWFGLGFLVFSAWYLGSTLARFLRER
ncbi:MAG: hypothetical protein ACJ74M_05680 [Gaiellaceae bacterium]|jgi:hypothetical protein